jgi:Zn-dependent M16 (insulinase) family peptidase
VLVAKEVQNLPLRKRSGGSVANATIWNMTVDSTLSPSQAGGLLAQLETLPRIADEIRDEPAKVIAALETIRKALVDPEVLRVYVSGDILSLPKPRSTFADKFISVAKAVPRIPVPAAQDFLTPLGKNPAKKLELVSMGAMEGSYSAHVSRGPQGWDHPDAAALLVATKVLETMESYLWKAVRGSGLAYGAYVNYDLENGTTEFSVHRSPNAFLAYAAAAKVVRGLADGTVSPSWTTIDCK